MMRVLFEREAAGETALDHDFLAGHTVGFAALRDDVLGESWPDIVAESGITEEQIRRCAKIYLRPKTTIICYGVGKPKHQKGYQHVQQYTKLQRVAGDCVKPRKEKR